MVLKDAPSDSIKISAQLGSLLFTQHQIIGRHEYLDASHTSNLTLRHATRSVTTWICSFCSRTSGGLFRV